MRANIEAQLASATAELRAHMASWEYAYAMGHSHHGGADHPVHAATHARTDELRRRCGDLQARLREYDD